MAPSQKVSSLLILVLLISPNIAFAQRPGILVGRAIVEVGMSREELAQVARTANQRLSALVMDADSVVMWDRVESQNSAVLANIIFENGRIRQIRKFWSLEGTARKDADLSRLIFELASAFPKNGQNACGLATETTAEPDGSMATTTVRCGRRSIEVTTITTRSGDRNVDVQEVID